MDGLKCVCDHSNCNEDGYCTTDPSGACYSSVNDIGDKYRGCFDETYKNLQCRNITGVAVIVCCQDTLCNNEYLPDMSGKDLEFDFKGRTFTSKIPFNHKIL